MSNHSSQSFDILERRRAKSAPAHAVPQGRRGLAKNALKSFLGRLMYGAGTHRLMLKNTAVIAAFHRVTERNDQDEISIGAGEFDAFCRLARKHFDVISLTELLARLRQQRDISTCLTVTFDDGYEDNREIAAPTLARWGLPATFFIATDIIGTAVQPYWDRENDVRTRWMSWKQVTELHAMGFEVGAHTRTHANLAELSPEAASAEIVGSKQALEQALGVDIDLFSYPFGGRQECSDEVRALVAEAGFRCCLSCHGGLVRPGDDPFHLMRMPVNRWYTDYWHFGAEILNDRRRLAPRA